MMVKENAGYYHKEVCYDFFLKEKEFKQSESENLDSLCKYIIELHDLIVVPRELIIRLQELRNGTIIQGGRKIKRYKEGVPFELIEDAYRLAADSIKWNLINKLNQNKDNKSLNYCFAIMQGKLNEAFDRQKIRERQELLNQKSKLNEQYIEREITYKKQNKQDNDISNYL